MRRAFRKGYISGLNLEQNEGDMLNRPNNINDSADTKDQNTTSKPAAANGSLTRGRFATLFSAITKPTLPLTTEDYILIATSFPNSM